MNSKSLKPLFFTLMACCVAVAVNAAPPNTASIDGRALEYDGGDLRAVYTTSVSGQGVAPWGDNNMLTNLYVTWDSNYLYVAANAWIAPDGIPNKIAIMIDVDPGAGTGARTTTNWVGPTRPGYIGYNDVGWTAFGGESNFGLDYMVASEGSSHNLVRVLYNGFANPTTNNVENLVDTFANISSPGSLVNANIRRVDATYQLNAVEGRIPWSTLYGQNTNRFGVVEPGEIVPRGAKIAVFVNIHNNNNADVYSSPMVIPTQGGNATWNNGRLVTDTYTEVVIDSTSNGIPDMAVGDVNAPYLRTLQGVQNKSQVYARFNEPLQSNTAVNAANWLVAGAAPTSVSFVPPDSVLLNLASPLPANGTFVRVEATGVEDLSGNTRTTFNFLNPVVSGIETAVTVRFVLAVNSGFGAAAANPRATNFFINGDFPMDWGYPPETTSPLAVLSATQHFRDVVFPPGSAQIINYKYSGILSGGSNATSNNNYEAIRLDQFGNTSRQLTLPFDGSSLVVTDWLGSAAGPYRDQNVFADYQSLYEDPRRGDAGVRQNSQVLFTVNLSGRNMAGVTRVILLGTDPLRGFNVAGYFNGYSDFPSSAIDADVNWMQGGLQMFDDGTNGDMVAGDGIYSLRRPFTTNGLSGGVSLVAGGPATPPYFGDWENRRSPRSFDYKFAVYKQGTDEVLLSPTGANLTQYLGPNNTNVVLATHVWANDGLPLPPPTNAPTLVDIEFANGQTTVVFTNAPGEAQHGVEYAFDLIAGFRDHGLRGIATQGLWEATFPGVMPDVLSYRAYSGPAPANKTTWWTPNPIPATGGTVTVWFSQIGRNSRGWPQVLLRGNIDQDGNVFEFGEWVDHPMTFQGNGLWRVELTVAPLSNDLTKARINYGFKNEPDTTWDQNFGPWGVDNYAIIVGSRASWTPERPMAGELLTITYDATGGVLFGGTNVHLHSGYNKFEGTDWSPAFENSPMTNIGGEVWTTTVQMNTNGFKTFNMLFRNNGDEVTWDSEYDPLHWVVFPGEL
ncbi:MAG TPA: hypothetical protein PKE26_02355 [Kiritimatiellia bacterium]|nr:hypothetical protein [Kiritimatiellia bacterium]HMO97930.1 hypothetical protein [Kiritimatiellia bacterium]HMP95281.1 hypothetical protein [Kiritimatiellia bacterium]